MKYEKPEIALIEAACPAIQGTGKFGMTYEKDTQPSIAAYEADE